MGHQSYVLLCTETILSNHPVVFPKLSCNVHLLRSPWTNPIPYYVNNINIHQEMRSVTVLCISVGMKSFSRFWKNHRYCRKKRRLIWKPSWFSFTAKNAFLPLLAVKLPFVGQLDDFICWATLQFWKRLHSLMHPIDCTYNFQSP